MKKSTSAHLALLLTNLLFAINFTAIKQLISGQFVQAFGINFIRIAVTAILLWVLYFFKKNKSIIAFNDYGRLFLCGLTGIAINQLLFVKGLSLSYSIHASLLMLVTPILITFIAAWLLKEKLSWNKILGLVLGISGAVILISARENSGEGTNVLLGDTLLILNAISYTFYFILVKPLMSKYEPIMILRMMFTIGFFLVLPFCWTEFSIIDWNSFSFNQYFQLFMVVVGGTFFAYLLNIYGLKVLGASTAGAYIYTQVVFATLIATIVLNEGLSLYKIISGLLIAAGLYIANKNFSNGTVSMGKNS